VRGGEGRFATKPSGIGSLGVSEHCATAGEIQRSFAALRMKASLFRSLDRAGGDVLQEFGQAVG